MFFISALFSDFFFFFFFLNVSLYVRQVICIKIWLCYLDILVGTFRSLKLLVCSSSGLRFVYVNMRVLFSFMSCLIPSLVIGCILHMSCLSHLFPLPPWLICVFKPIVCLCSPCSIASVFSFMVFPFGLSFLLLFVHRLTLACFWTLIFGHDLDLSVCLS